MKTLCLCFLCFVALPSHAQAVIDVQIKGFDDGVRSNKQTDYKEAVLFAKRQAIERAGVSVKSISTSKDFLLHSDYIESAAEAVLLPGYSIMDIGYQNDDTYLVILTGKVAQQNEQVNSAPGNQLRQALAALAEAPSQYQFELGGLFGTHDIEKAYFVDEQEFAIHYSYHNGVITLKDTTRGLMLVSGDYKTDLDKGSVSLDFNQDGTAEGSWKNWLSGGKILIRKR